MARWHRSCIDIQEDTLDSFCHISSGLTWLRRPRGTAAQSGFRDQAAQTRIGMYAVPKRIDGEPSHLPIPFLDSPFQPFERLILVSQSKTDRSTNVRGYVLMLRQPIQLRQKLARLGRLTSQSIGKSQTRVAPDRIAEGCCFTERRDRRRQIASVCVGQSQKVMGGPIVGMEFDRSPEPCDRFIKLVGPVAGPDCRSIDAC